MDAKAKIVQAFSELVLANHYDEFKTGDIIERAGVAKATFYAHFRNRDDVLLHSVRPILDVFIDGYKGRADAIIMRETLEHIWENRAIARTLMGPPFAHKLIQSLVETAAATHDHAEAVFTFHGVIGLLHQWTCGRIALSADELAIELGGRLARGQP